jgi:hypothetical protein
MVKFQSTAVLMAVAATSWGATTANSGSGGGPSSYGSYSGYGEYQQQQQQPQHQQIQGQWYSQSSQMSSYQRQQQPETTTEEQAPLQGDDVSDERPLLPDGWEELFDPNSGEYYYYNHADGTTTWDRPEPPEPAEESTVASTQEQQQLDEIPKVAQEPYGVAEEEEEHTDGGHSGFEMPSEVNTLVKQEAPKDDVQEEPSGWRDSHSPEIDGKEQRYWSQLPNSTIPPIPSTPAEEPPKREYQQPLTQQEPLPGGWGIPTKPEEHPSQPAAWGVRNPSGSQGPPPQQQQQPPFQLHGSPEPSRPSLSQPPREEGRWGMPPTGSMSRNMQQQQTPLHQSSPPGGHRPMDDLRPPQQHQGPSLNQGPPTGQTPPLQQQQPPPNVPRQYQQQPRYGQYFPNAPPGYNPYGQYSQPYGGAYGASQQQQQSSTGQLISQGYDDGTSVVREALSSTWKGLLGFGNRTREAVETAREQVVTSATAAGQTLGARGSSEYYASV